MTLRRRKLINTVGFGTRAACPASSVKSQKLNWDQISLHLMSDEEFKSKSANKLWQMRGNVP